MPPIITKSKFISGLQCSKLLWSLYNAKESIPQPGEQASALFEQGNEITALARSMFSNGIDARSGGPGFSEVLSCTRNLLGGRQPIFEASLTFGDTYTSADILDPSGTDGWDIIEVKSSTSVKDVYLQDLAFQWFVYIGAGLQINKAYILHINNQFIKAGSIDPHQFFTKVDVTEPVRELLVPIADQVRAMQRTIAAATCPEIKVGGHCSNPYPCPLEDRCWSFLPEHNVFTLVRGGSRTTTLFDQDIYDIKDIPDDFALSSKQETQRGCVRTGQPYIDPAGIREFLGRLEYPLYFLDFETINTAIPIFDGVRPFQQIPFQFSLHILASENAELEHHMFLADGAEDPRRAFVERLKEVAGERGSIVTYNAAFEKRCLRECCAAIGGYDEWLQNIMSRIVDLLEPFRSFYFYHPSQKGSASIKAVLPALTGKDYSHLEIQNGGDASLQYLQSLQMEENSPGRLKIRHDLEQYCTLDTAGMIHILAALEKLVESK